MSDEYDPGKHKSGAFAAAAGVVLQPKSSLSLLSVLPPEFSVCGFSFPSLCAK